MLQVLPVCECVAAALKPGCGVATAVALIVTFCDGVKPFSELTLVAVPEKYTPFWSAAYCSSYVAMLRRSDVIAATYDFSFVFEHVGIAIAQRRAMMTTTIRSSIRVKPFLLLI